MYRVAALSILEGTLGTVYLGDLQLRGRTVATLLDEGDGKVQATWRSRDARDAFRKSCRRAPELVLESLLDDAVTFAHMQDERQATFFRVVGDDEWQCIEEPYSEELAQLLRKEHGRGLRIWNEEGHLPVVVHDGAPSPPVRVQGGRTAGVAA